jgi:hypothetical protein
MAANETSLVNLRPEFASDMRLHGFQSKEVIDQVELSSEFNQWSAARVVVNVLNNE